jgi:hypothetical protein
VSEWKFLASLSLHYHPELLYFVSGSGKYNSTREITPALTEQHTNTSLHKERQLSNQKEGYNHSNKTCKLFPSLSCFKKVK